MSTQTPAQPLLHMSNDPMYKLLREGCIKEFNVKKAAGEEHWDGGTILDPNNGKTYKVRLTPKDGGKVLEVRGFIGPFYRNQKWLRLE